MHTMFGRVLVVSVLAMSSAALSGAVAASASTPRAAVVVKAPPGAGEPTPGSGIGTRAALNNPRCNTDKQFGVYGRFDSHHLGGGQICVRPFAAGDDNGGATTRGVTGDSIKIVGLLPIAGSAQATSSTNRATGTSGNDRDALHDLFMAQMQYYETWGRDIEVVFIEQSGTDEAAQRADALKVLEEKPFAVILLDTNGADVFESAIASSKTLVFGYSASPNETAAQAPYRWAGNDPQAGMINSAEVIGKQLVGKKAEWAGDADLKGGTRVFGLVAMEFLDLDEFNQTLAKYKGKVAVTSTYPANGSTFGDTATSQQAAPAIVGRMKSAGVTTVVLGTDVAMNLALMTQASRQEWHPEWFATGTGYYDLFFFTQALPPEQASHMFGLVLNNIWTEPDPESEYAPVDWYWGAKSGTVSLRNIIGSRWLFDGIHTAGPNLTPKTFRQGLFSIPLRGGSADGNPATWGPGYGRNAGLPYDNYSSGQIDFAIDWIDPTTVGIAPAAGTPNKPAQMFVLGGQRFKIGEWPTKKIAFFDPSKSVASLTGLPEGLTYPEPNPCTGCPSTGGSTLTPGSPSTSGFVAEVPASPSS